MVVFVDVEVHKYFNKTFRQHKTGLVERSIFTHLTLSASINTLGIINQRDLRENKKVELCLGMVSYKVMEAVQTVAVDCGYAMNRVLLTKS